MKAKINFITVAVDDIEQSKHFYKSVFKFPVSNDSEELCLFELEDNFYFVIEKREAFIGQAGDEYSLQVKSAGFILSHNAAWVQEVQQIVAVAEEHGARQIKVLDEDWGYSVTIADINGHRWEILYAING